MVEIQHTGDLGRDRHCCALCSIGFPAVGPMVQRGDAGQGDNKEGPVFFQEYAVAAGLTQFRSSVTCYYVLPSLF